MTRRERERFDALLEEVMDGLPPGIAELIEEVPVVVEDEPDGRLLREMALEAGEDPEDWGPDSLCGLHTGAAFTERSVETPEMSSEIRLFRRGIIAEAGGWEPQDGETPDDVDDAVFEEIRITLLHEIGHQFGLDEDDLKRLGYE